MIGQTGVNPMLAQEQMTPEQKQKWDQVMMILGGLAQQQVPPQTSLDNLKPLLGGLSGPR